MTENTEAVALLPCPFCGGTVLHIQHPVESVWRIECAGDHGCGANIFRTTARAVDHAWNTRPAANELSAKIEWLLNEKALAEQQVELQGVSALPRAADRLHEAYCRAFNLLPDILASLNPSPALPEPDEWFASMPQELADSINPLDLRALNTGNPS